MSFFRSVSVGVFILLLVISPAKGEDFMSLVDLSISCIWNAPVESYLSKISYETLFGIAYTESYLYPFAIYSENNPYLKEFLKGFGIPYLAGKKGVSVFPLDVEQAVRTLAFILKKDLYYDVGLFQISKSKILDYRLDPFDLLNPAFNTKIALKILRICEQRFSSEEEIINCFHLGENSPYVYMTTAYQRKVQSLFRKD